MRYIATLLAVFASLAAHAQSDYPAKPIQFVICYAPGGGVDVVARIVAERLTRTLGRPGRRYTPTNRVAR